MGELIQQVIQFIGGVFLLVGYWFLMTGRMEFNDTRYVSINLVAGTLLAGTFIYAHQWSALGLEACFLYVGVRNLVTGGAK